MGERVFGWEGLRGVHRWRWGRILLGLTPKKVMTSKEHKTYRHMCGRTGTEINDDEGICRKCELEKREECLRDHAVLGLDW